jgi:outer membrane lipoprotein LolB
MKRRGIAAIGAVFTLNLIAGCAVGTGPTGIKDQKSKGHSEPQTFSGPYSGRLSLQIEPEAGSTAPTQSFSGSFEVRGNAEIGELDLLTPLGQIVMRLRWRPDIAVIFRGTERQIYADAQDLIQQATSASLSLAQLFSWLDGKPTTSPPSSAQGAQSGEWQVDLTARAQGRIIARRTQPTPAVLRIAIEMP